ncbi:angiopoietin-related protein 7-like [Branchiostoma lanceolatum]|uniref:angiopoietin-related protein 7-like n=1 Tax=Branchiostoma lanceolatum TaxID=7740 RepID=UPI003451308F
MATFVFLLAVFCFNLCVAQGDSAGDGGNSTSGATVHIWRGLEQCAHTVVVPKTDPEVCPGGRDTVFFLQDLKVAVDDLTTRLTRTENRLETIEKQFQKDQVQVYSSLTKVLLQEKENFKQIRRNTEGIYSLVQAAAQRAADTSTSTAGDGAVEISDVEAYEIEDCSSLFRSGTTASGVYSVRLNPALQMEVYCDMETSGGGWTVIQRRQDGSVPFNRTWEEYKQGFGNKNGEYWLGNDIIHFLTTQKAYRLRVDLEEWGGQRRFSEYNTFRVGGPVQNSTQNYRLEVSGYQGNAGDAMIINNGMSFSTIDRDNDVLRGSCSRHRGNAGWWFRACGSALLNGRYLGNCGSSCLHSQGVLWGLMTQSLKSVSMKIKPQ